MKASAKPAEVKLPTLAFKLDKQTLHAFEGETILKAAQRHGVDIPHLCHKDGLRADGNCRACVVEIKGERTLAPSCCRSVTAGMEVQANSERAVKSRKMVLELLLSDMPDVGHKWNDTNDRAGSVGQHGELSEWAARLGVTVRPELQVLRRAQPPTDASHPAMAVNLDACIQCTRCVRACREVQVNDVMGYAHRGAQSQVVFDLNDAMGDSSCVACGECVQACPTGALMPKTQMGSQAVDKTVDSVCPFCGVGCLLTYKVRGNKIVSVDGRDGQSFMTETAWLADVVLPASAWPEKTGSVSNTDRMLQLGRQAIDPPGDARPDLWIIQQIAHRMGLTWNYPGENCGVALVHEEMRQTMHTAIGGISWERLQREGSVTYPCLSADDPGLATVFTDHFPTPDGRAHLVPTTLTLAAEKPDAAYPLVLITGRQLEHWHTGSMTRRSAVLDALEPVATASVNVGELARLGLTAGAMVTLRSRRGTLDVQLRRDDGTPDGTVFMPFAYREAAANLLTHAALDPVGKIPEFKYCAVCITPVS